MLGFNTGSDWLAHWGINGIDLGPFVVNRQWNGSAANVYTSDAPVPALVKGDTFCGDPLVTNTGAATMNVNSLGALAITKLNGTALAAGDLVAGVTACIYYNGSAFTFGAGPQTFNQLASTDIGFGNSSNQLAGSSNFTFISGSSHVLLNGTYSGAVFASNTANSAATGLLRFAQADSICSRNAANTADQCFSVDGSSNWSFNGVVKTNINFLGLYFSDSLNPASTGALRLANTDQIAWRNNANTGDDTFGVNTGDLLVYGSNIVPSFTGTWTPTDCAVLSSTTGVLQAASCGGGVTSFTGDGTVLSNSGSTGAVTATLATAATDTVLGNPTAGTAAPVYTNTPVLSGVKIGTSGPSLSTGGITDQSVITNLTFQGGLNTTSNNVYGSGTITGGTITGGANAGTAGNGICAGANDASTSASSSAGSCVIESGQATAGGKQGGIQLLISFTVSAALGAAHEAVCGTSTTNQVAACTAAQQNVVGEAETVGGTGTAIYVGVKGNLTLVFDGTPVLGDVVCYPPTAGTTGEFHDNGTAACASSQFAGTVVANVSGTGAGATATVAVK